MDKTFGTQAQQHSNVDESYIKAQKERLERLICSQALKDIQAEMGLQKFKRNDLPSQQEMQKMNLAIKAVQNENEALAAKYNELLSELQSKILEMQNCKKEINDRTVRLKKLISKIETSSSYNLEMCLSKTSAQDEIQQWQELSKKQTEQFERENEELANQIKEELNSDKAAKKAEIAVLNEMKANLDQKLVGIHMKINRFNKQSNDGIIDNETLAALQEVISTVSENISGRCNKANVKLNEKLEKILRCEKSIVELEGYVEFDIRKVIKHTNSKNKREELKLVV